jgi:hypothetical protein
MTTRLSSATRSSLAVLPSWPWRCSRTGSARRVSAPHQPEPHHETTDWHSPLGKPVSHQFAKELLAGFAGGEVDRLAETKGEDFFDREKAKHQAKQNAEQLYDQHYGQYDEYNPNQQQPHGRMQESFGNNFGNDNNY